MVHVSVVLPVYNGEKYLREAITSILDQTFSDFELIIINDGSKDRSSDRIGEFKDPRIVYVEQENAGLASTLNRGIAMARGKYIARQDQDDISLPERLAKQVAFLEAHPHCGLVGTWAEIFSETESGVRYHRHPTDFFDLRLHLHFRNPFVHSSVMMRKDVVVPVGCYATAKDRQPPEDYELWSRIARVSHVANIGDVLLRYREVTSSMSRVSADPFGPMVYKIACENVASTLLGSPLAQHGNDLVSVLQRYPYERTLHVPWRVIVATMNAVVMSVSRGQGARNVALLAEAEAMLVSARTDYDLTRVPRFVRNSVMFKVLKPILRRVYRLACTRML